MLVFDSGEKRNEASLVQHAILGADGFNRRRFLDQARQQASFLEARGWATATGLGSTQPEPALAVIKSFKWAQCMLRPVPPTHSPGFHALLPKLRHPFRLR